MVIVSGRLSPLFGDDELTRLRQYAASITAEQVLQLAQPLLD